MRVGLWRKLSTEESMLFFFYFKLYNIVLVLPNIKMNPPQVYMCSPSWTFLPPPSPYHPLGHPSAPAPSIQYRASNLDWWLISYMTLCLFPLINIMISIHFKMITMINLTIQRCCIIIIFKKFLLFFFLLYNIVLVLPYINMHLPWVYTCSPSWNPSHLPPHTIPLGHPSATSPSFLYPASNLDWRFTSYMILYMF